MAKTMPKDKVKNRINNVVTPATPSGNGTHLAQDNKSQNEEQPYFPAFEEIQVRAYQIYQERGGSDLDNWLQAESDLREEFKRGREMGRSQGLPAVQTVTKEELRAKIKNNEKIQILNVLSPDQYHLGSIKGSIKIPLSELDQRMSELDKSKEVITFCASSECLASAQAADKLAAQGFNVCAYEGGLKEWKEAGYPVE